MAEEPLPPQQSADQAPNVEDAPAPPRGTALAAWVMDHVRPWRDERDKKHRKKWDEFVRIWRGEWSEEDKNRKTERSKIITPASMQALDSTVSEIEEAIFRREAWFDADEDMAEMDDPEQRQEILRARDLLLELAAEEKIPSSISKIVLMGALYGTGIGKVNVYVKDVPSLVVGDDGRRRVNHAEEARVELIPLEPYEFVPDPTTDDLEAMLGSAHETMVPIHEVREGMKDGRYRPVTVGPWNPTANDPGSKDGMLFSFEGPVPSGVKITEWHGKVPAALLAMYLNPDDEFVNELASGADPEEELVEAVVTIANEATVLSAKPNPFIMQDRPFVAYQHDTVPNYFWGRGVIEKAYNAQKALDSDIRARIDSIALVANPMLAGDITRLPRGMNLAVWPGKFWPTTGKPGDILESMQFGNVSPELFSNAADMERMVQSATGALDPGVADGAQDRALLSSAFIKRSRRTMMNIEWNLLQPTVQKMMWRYVQFSPLFPKDFKFTVRGTLGVMAREIEQQQDNQLLSLVPNESKPFMAIVKNIFSNRSGTGKAEIIKALDEMLNPSEEQQAAAQKQAALAERAQMAQIMEQEAKAQKAQAEADEARAKATLAQAQAQIAPLEVQAEMLSVANDAREVQAFERQNDISEQGMELKSVDLALRAAKLPAEIDKLEADAAKLRRPGPG